MDIVLFELVYISEYITQLWAFGVIGGIKNIGCGGILVCDIASDLFVAIIVIIDFVVDLFECKHLRFWCGF